MPTEDSPIKVTPTLRDEFTSLSDLLRAHYDDRENNPELPSDEAGPYEKVLYPDDKARIDNVKFHVDEILATSTIEELDALAERLNDPQTGAKEVAVRVGDDQAIRHALEEKIETHRANIQQWEENKARYLDAIHSSETRALLGVVRNNCAKAFKEKKIGKSQLAELIAEIGMRDIVISSNVRLRIIDQINKATSINDLRNIYLDAQAMVGRSEMLEGELTQVSHAYDIKLEALKRAQEVGKIVETIKNA